jgi:alpha-tubulin suppressor-like RCC1 family protein
VSWPAAGTALAWGDNSTGELGDGTTAGSDTPVMVSFQPGTKVRSISAGCELGLARTAKGHVLAWGNDLDGELGDGGTASRGLPGRVQLPAGLPAIAVSSGPNASFGLAITRRAKP